MFSLDALRNGKESVHANIMGGNMPSLEGKYIKLLFERYQ